MRTPYLDPRRARRSFVFDGRELCYNRIPYNNSAERAVEVPIAFDFVRRRGRAGRWCEVGNVLANYERRPGRWRRRIVDRFEVSPGVENVDIRDLPLRDSFDSIISISTVEHVGQAHHRPLPARERDLLAPLRAIAHIYDLLADGGEALITAPYGRLLDGGWFIQLGGAYVSLLRSWLGIPDGGIRCAFMRRLQSELVGESPRQLWRQARGMTLTDVEFNAPLPSANAIVVMKLRKLGPRHPHASRPPRPAVSPAAVVGSLWAPSVRYRPHPGWPGWVQAEDDEPLFSAQPQLGAGAYRIELSGRARRGEQTRFALAVRDEHGGWRVHAAPARRAAFSFEVPFRARSRTTSALALVADTVPAACVIERFAIVPTRGTTPS